MVLGQLLMRLVVVAGVCAASEFLDFGQDFVFGTVMDAYQFEGEPPVRSTGERASSLDVWCQWFVHESNSSSAWSECGDVASGFHAHMTSDIALMAALGQKHLHFQIDWARVFPDGMSGKASAAGVAFYASLVDALLSKDMTPWVSLSVWDFPDVHRTDVSSAAG